MQTVALPLGYRTIFFLVTTKFILIPLCGRRATAPNYFSLLCHNHEPATTPKPIAAKDKLKKAPATTIPAPIFIAVDLRQTDLSSLPPRSCSGLAITHKFYQIKATPTSIPIFRISLTPTVILSRFGSSSLSDLGIEDLRLTVEDLTENPDPRSSRG